MERWVAVRPSGVEAARDHIIGVQSAHQEQSQDRQQQGDRQTSEARRLAVGNFVVRHVEKTGMFGPHANSPQSGSGFPVCSRRHGRSVGWSRSADLIDAVPRAAKERGS